MWFTGDVMPRWLKQIWQAGGLIFGLLFLSAWGLGLYRVDSLERTSPSKPDPAFGQMTPEHWKGLTVYVTSGQAVFIERVHDFEMASLLIVFAVPLWGIRKKLYRPPGG